MATLSSTAEIAISPRLLSRADMNAYIHGVSHAALNVHSHVLSFSSSPSLSLSVSIHDIYIGVRGSEVNLGATTRSYYRVGWALIPIFQSTYRARPTPHGLSKASRGLTRVKGKINKPVQKPDSLSFSFSLSFSLSLYSLCLCVKRTGVCVDTYTCLPMYVGRMCIRVTSMEALSWLPGNWWGKLDERWSESHHKWPFFCFRKTHFAMIFSV